MIDLTLLSAPFPPSSIEWRVGSTTQDKSKGRALAYLTARDVMDRLDTVCGVANWQDRYEFHGTRTICYLSVRLGDEWVTKADGAGDSDVEAEKGAISDALKRAAVKWGVGRYLYEVESPWVELEPAGRSYKIKETEKRKLELALTKASPVTAVTSQAPQQKPPTVIGHKTPGGRTRRAGTRLTDSYEIMGAMTALLENVAGKPNPDALKKWATSQRDEIGSLPDKAFDEFMAKYEGELEKLTKASALVSTLEAG